MPTYEYECEKCGNTEEHYQRMSDRRIRICSKLREGHPSEADVRTGLLPEGRRLGQGQLRGSQTSQEWR